MRKILTTILICIPLAHYFCKLTPFVPMTGYPESGTESSLFLILFCQYLEIPYTKQHIIQPDIISLGG